jgi:hypothetical protein
MEEILQKNTTFRVDPLIILGIKMSVYFEFDIKE